MMDSKLEIIFKELIDKEYHTAHEIAKKLKRSEKTARILVKELDILIKTHGAWINSKPKMGYQLIILDESKFYIFYNQLGESKQERLPITPTERVHYILEFLLDQKNYKKIDDLCDYIYISRNTLTADLKKVEYILNMYNLTLERKPNHGLMVSGREFDKRICIANNLIKSNSSMEYTIRKYQELQIINDIMLRAIHNHNIIISKNYLESLIVYLYITIRRIRDNWHISIDYEEIKHLLGEKVLQATEGIISQIKEKMCVSFTEEEVYYLALHMETKLSSGSYKKYGSNIIISQEIDDLVFKMLDVIYNGFKIDFRNNFELRMSLNQHMVSFDIRIQYGIHLKNSLLEEIQKEYAFAYTIAATACIVLKEHYKVNITEDEIGYFAILFALALEKQNNRIIKKNIVVVCSSGKSTTKLFMYKYKQAFEKYINNIYECTIYELEIFDFEEKNIDYVFTTISINIQVPVPVFKVNLFLSNKDIIAYSNLFEIGSDEFLYKYYKKDLFLTNIQGNRKEDIIKQLCEHTKRYYDIPTGFYEAVMQREKLGNTGFGNLVAIPHPLKVITKENFVTIGILNEAVWWGHNEVQVVFLISISTEENADIEQFYQITTKLLFSENDIRYLIDHPKFEVLMLLLKSKLWGENTENFV